MNVYDQAINYLVWIYFTMLTSIDIKLYCQEQQYENSSKRLNDHMKK